MTSSHPIWFVPASDSSAKIGLTPCPGTQDALLEASLSELKEWGAHAILSLMLADEMVENKVASLGEETQKQGMNWFHLPIEDDEVPLADFEQSWKTVGPQVHELLDNGKSIAIHCKGGSGRTGMVAARIMLERGANLEECIAQIKEQRPGAFRAPLQQDYAKKMAEMNQ